MLHRLLAAALPCAVVLCLAGSASAASLIGGVDDPAGDVSGPELDITAAAVTYDPQGIVQAAVTTAAPATEQNVALAKVMLGTASRSSGLCRIGVSVAMYPEAEPWGGIRKGRRDLRLQAVTQSGPVLQFNTADGNGFGEHRGPSRALAGESWDCGVVTTYSPKETHGDYTLIDDTGVFPLTARTDVNVPSCRLLTRKTRRRGRLRVACVNVTGKVTIRLHRGGRPRARRVATIGAGGRAAVRLRRVKRGEYLATVWQRGALMGSEYITVR